MDFSVHHDQEQTKKNTQNWTSKINKAKQNEQNTTQHNITRQHSQTKLINQKQVTKQANKQANKETKQTHKTKKQPATATRPVAFACFGQYGYVWLRALVECGDDVENLPGPKHISAWSASQWFQTSIFFKEVSWILRTLGMVVYVMWIFRLVVACISRIGKTWRTATGWYVFFIDHLCNRTPCETYCTRRIEMREYCHAMFRPMPC